MQHKKGCGIYRTLFYCQKMQKFFKQKFERNGEKDITNQKKP